MGSVANNQPFGWTNGESFAVAPVPFQYLDGLAGQVKGHCVKYFTSSGAGTPDVMFRQACLAVAVYMKTNNLQNKTPLLLSVQFGGATLSSICVIGIAFGEGAAQGQQVFP